MADISYTYVVSPLTGFGTIVRSSDEAFIPCALANLDYQAFLQWLAEGNPAPEGWSGPTNDAPA